MLIDEQVADSIKNATQLLNFYAEFEFGKNVEYFSSSSFVVNTTLHNENFTAFLTPDLPVLTVGLELTLSPCTMDFRRASVSFAYFASLGI